ncbi:hypothetical protein CVD28_00645 [Bacillus sp. M6-12]|uniref:hypothetical protein n=1 Tax=Bacillus sp. M6-12 TaxID=2054166 RepID=UPI000C779A1E|nr:hypothetical protein [Bacillus sp. M6-12]PLS18941.1 hypothetical protein CVD28_00645 [Bacillus sp. M6-12]
MFTVAVKSGTNGYSDYDNCDKILAEFPSNNIPNVGDILEFEDAKNGNWQKYLVREVKRSYNHKNNNQEFREWIRVYVINA